MKNLALILFFLSLDVSMYGQTNKAQTQDDSFSIFGTWKVVEFTAGSISGITDREAKEYIGRLITLEKDTAVFLHERCFDQIQYRIRTANAEEYLYFNYKFPPIELGIDEKEIYILEVYCSEDPIDLDFDDPFYEFIIYKNQYLIDSWDGYFFFLERQ